MSTFDKEKRLKSTSGKGRKQNSFRKTIERALEEDEEIRKDDELSLRDAIDIFQPRLLRCIA